jgi:hypothetical protein
VSFLSVLIRQWWFWCFVVPLSLLAVTGLTIRRSGQLAWQREQAAVRAAGEPVDFAAVVALAPPVDGARQTALRVLDQSLELHAATRSSPYATQPMLWLWGIATGASGVPTPWPDAADRAARRAVAQRFTAICRSGPVVTGSLGWMRAEWPAPDQALAYDLMDLSGCSFRLGEILHAAALEQVVVGAAAEGLDCLDALEVATRAVGSRSDALCRIIALRRRDEVYLRAVTLGRIDAARCQAWLAEPPTAAADFATALRRSRAEWLAALGSERWDPRIYGLPAGWMALVHDAVFLPHQVARWSQRTRVLAAALQGEPFPGDLAAWRDEVPDGGSGALGYGLLNLVPDFATFAVTAEQRHRLLRAAARAYLAWRNGALPVDDAQAQHLLGADLHASPHLLPPLLYTRLSASRFRLGLDPHGPLPATVPEDERKRFLPSPSRAVPPPVRDAAWWFELDCAAPATVVPDAAVPPAPASAAP